MLDIKWIIEWMQCKPNDGLLTDVVLTASWRCIGFKVVGNNTFYGTNYGIASFPQPEENGQFTPYNELTQDQVLSWCWLNGVDKSAIETGVQLQIADAINPPIIQPPLPWVQ